MKPRRNSRKGTAVKHLIDRLPLLNEKTIVVIRFVVYGLAILALLMVSLLHFVSSDRADVIATSEARLRQISVEFSPGDMLPRWEALDGQIVDADENPAGTYCKQGIFAFAAQHRGEVGANMNVGFNISGSATSPIIATVQYLSPKTIGNLGNLICTDDRPLPPQFDLVLSLANDANAQWASAFSGRFVMGDTTPVAMAGAEDFHRAPNGLIESGQLTTEVRAFPFGSATIKTTTDLYPGDSVSFLTTSKAGKQIRPVSYIIAKRDGDELKVVSRTRAEQIEVKRSGEANVPSTDLAPPLWARFRAQEEWLLWLAAFFVLRGLWGAYVSYVSTADRQREGD